MKVQYGGFLKCGYTHSWMVYFMENSPLTDCSELWAWARALQSKLYRPLIYHPAIFLSPSHACTVARNNSTRKAGRNQSMRQCLKFSRGKKTHTETGSNAVKVEPLLKALNSGGLHSTNGIFHIVCKNPRVSVWLSTRESQLIWVALKKLSTW
jgi:hypothetical protein